VFLKKKSNKKSTFIDLQLEKSDFNYFQIKLDYPGSSSIPTILENAVKKEECCYRIAKYNISYRKNIEISVINRFKKVDLKLIIPDKLKIKSLQSMEIR